MVWGLGCRVWGLGCRVWGLGCRVWGLGCRVWGLGCRVWGLGCRVWGLGCRIYNLRFRVQSIEFRLQMFFLKQVLTILRFHFPSKSKEIDFIFHQNRRKSLRVKLFLSEIVKYDKSSQGSDKRKNRKIVIFVSLQLSVPVLTGVHYCLNGLP